MIETSSWESWLFMKLDVELLNMLHLMFESLCFYCLYKPYISRNHILLWNSKAKYHTEKIKAMKEKTEKEKNCVSNIGVKVTDGGEI